MRRLDGYHQIVFEATGGVAENRPFQTNTTYIAVGPTTRTQTLDVTMAPTRTLSGVVHLGDDSRTARPGEVEVYILDWISTPFPVDADGRYRIPGLSDGSRYRLQFVYKGSESFISQWSGGGSVLQESTLIGISGDRNYDVTLARGGVVRGTVSTPYSGGPGGIRVTASTTTAGGHTFSASGVADASGHGRSPGCPRAPTSSWHGTIA